jgi:hypothetical protein
MSVIEPTTIFAGAPVTWTKSLSDYPAGTWTLTYTFLNATGKFTVVCSASGTDHVATISAVASAALVAGVYGWQSKATKTGAAAVVEYGETLVVADYAAATTLETRTDAAIIAAAILAVLKGRATEDQLAVSIAGRSITKMTLAELRTEFAAWSAVVAKEKRAAAIAAGTRPRGKTLARFP